MPGDWKKQRTLCKTEEDFVQAIENDYNQIKDYIEGSVLDIGCGLGGVDVLIYKNTKNKLYLLDSDGDSPEYGYKQHRRDFYNSLEKTKEMMDLNGVEGYTIIDANKDELPLRVDTVISLLSWGYHYNFYEYWHEVKALLPKRVVLDLRNGQFPEEMDGATIIDENNKYRRVCLCL